MAESADLIVAFMLLVFAYFTGSWIERRHYREIRRRESRWRRLPAVTFRQHPKDWYSTAAW